MASARKSQFARHVISDNFEIQKAMNKPIYFYTIFFQRLIIAAIAVQGLINFMLGSKVNAIPSYLQWSLAMNLIFLIGSLLVVNYYLYKKYWFALVFGGLTTIAHFSSFIILNTITSSVQLMTYYLPAITITAGFGLIYGISLIFSVARQRPWLRLAGIVIAIIYAILLMVFISWMISPEIQKIQWLDQIVQWTTLANILVSVLLIRNFLNELERLKKENKETARQKYGKYGLFMIRFIAVIFIIISGVFFVQGSQRAFYEKQNYELAKILDVKFEERVFVGSQGDTLQYRLLKPLDYNSAKKYPLMVSLHGGGGGIGNDNIEYLSSQPVPLLSKSANRVKYPTFLFVPKCPLGSSFGKHPNYPSVDALVFEAINALEMEFNIDKNRRYVAGISGGGYGTWNFISSQPKMFAAALPICGGGDPKFGPNLTEVAIWAFHGAKDRKVPVNLSRDMIEAIKKAGGNPRYTEFPYEGHDIWKQVIAEPGLLDWLFEQRREN